MSQKHYTEDDVRSLIREEANRAGSQAALAQRWEVAPAYLSDVLLGKRTPGPKILTPLGLTEAAHVYVPITTTN